MDIAGERLAVDELHVRVQRLVKIVETANLIDIGERICGDYPWNGSKVAIYIFSVIFHDRFLSLYLRNGLGFGDNFDWKCNALKSVTQSSQLTQRNCSATTSQKTWQKLWQLISQCYGSDNKQVVRNLSLVTTSEVGTLRIPLKECAWMEKALSLDIVNM